MAFNRDLSQLANFLEINSDGTFVNIIPSQSEAQLGIGTNNPTAKLDVLGNARVSGIVSATTFVGNLTGLASSATQLATGRTVAITGDLAYTSGAFDGTGNVTGVGTLANTAVTPGSYGSSTEVATFTVDSKGRLTAAGTASVGTALTVAGDSGSENISLLSETLTISGGTNLTSSAASNTVTVNLDDNISLVSVVASGVITATSGFSGNVTGNLTGEVNAPSFDTNASGVVVTGVTTSSNGFVGDLTGNVSGNVTGNINSSGVSTVTSLNATNINASGIVTATSGFVGNLTGTATSTTNIPNLTGDITSDNTATTLATVNSNVGSFGSQTLIPVVTVNAKGLVTAVTTAAVGTALTVSGDSGSENIDLLSETLTISGGTNLTSSAASNTVTVNLDPNISLTSVVASGIVTATSGFSGNLTGEVNAPSFDTNASGVVVTGIATATSGFSGNLTGNVTGNLTGVASTATKLQNSRDFSIGGSFVTATAVSFDGTGNVSLAATIAPNSIELETYTSGNYVATVADSGSSDITVSGSGSETAAVTLGLSTTGVAAGSYGSSTAIPTFTVDSRGRLTAAGTAAVGTALTVAGDSGSGNVDLLSETLTIAGGTNLTSSASGETVTVNLDDNISLTSVVASGIITAAQFVTGASGSAIGINTNTISGPATITIDPAAVGDNTGLVVIKGDLQIDGTTTTINSTTVTVDDLNIVLADGAVNDAAANGGGITVQSGDGNKTFQFEASGDNLGSSENLNVASGKVYKVNNTEVLSSNTLGSGVVNSSLTSVGTLGQLNVSGVTTSSGGFSGNLTGNVTGNLTGEVNAPSFDTNAFGVVVTGVTTSSNGFVGDLTGNASTATALQTGRDFSISGDATASAISFNGTANVGLALTLANTGVTTGSYGSASQIPTFTVDSKGRLTAAGTVNVSTGMTVAGDSGSETINLLTETLTIAGGTNLTSSATSDTVTVNLDDNISLVSVSASGVVTATSGFSGNVTGNLTGEVNAPSFDTNASGVVVTGVTTSSNGFVGNLTGLASSATQLQTSRDFSISGDATASSISFDGTANVGLALTLANTAVTPGSYGSSTQIPTFTVDSKGRLTAAGTASVGTALTVSGDSGSENIDLLSETLTISGGTNLTSSAASNAVTVNLDDNISLVSVVASGIVTATSGFSGNVTGNVTGNLNSSGVSTVTSLNATNINASGIVTATSGFVGNLTGLASSATQLATGRTVAITGDLAYTSGAFDGTGNVTGTGTLATVNSNVGSFGSQTLIPVVTVNAKGLVTAVTTAAVGTALTVAGDSGSENIDLLTESLTISGGTNLTSSSASNTVTVNLDDNISLTSVVASGVVTATSGFSGNVTGNLTGEVNAPSFDTNASGVVVTGIATATTFVGALTGNVTGNLNSSGVSTVTSLNATNINASGIVTATSGFVGNLTGTATSTTNIPNLTGDITSDNLATTLATVNSNVGSFGSQTLIPVVTVNAKGLVTAVTTAAVGTAFTVSGDSGSENIDLLTETLTISGGTNLTSSAASNSVTVNLDPNISLTSVVASGIVTATSGFSGNLTGDINSSGVSTVTSLNATNINTSGIVTAAQFVTGASGSAIGINTNTISGPATITIDPAAVGDNTGLVVIKGDLQIDGTTTTINSTTVTVDDKNIQIADGAANDAAADGAGITITSGDGNKTFQFQDSGDNLGSSENLNVASGKVYKINNTEVLSSTTLGSGVVNSSLTSVGTLTNLSVGNVNSSGIITATTFVGALTGNVTGDINSSGVSTVTSLNATNINASGIVTATSGFVGNLTGTASTTTNIPNLTGDITSDNTATTLATVNSNVGSFGSQTLIPVVTVNAKGLVTAVTTAAVGTALTVAGDSGSENIDLLSEVLTISGGTNLTSSAASNSVTVNLDPNISLTSVVASGVITATSGFSGNLTGNVTGNINSSGVSTVTNLNIDGYVSIGNTTGAANQVIASTGVGVTWKNFNDLLPQTRTTQTFTATAGQTLFSFVYNVNFLDVFVNGVKLSSGEFTASNGSTITLSEGAFVNDTVEFVSYSTLGAGTGQVSSLNDLTDVTLSGIATGNLLAYNGSEFVNTSNINISGISTLNNVIVGGATTALVVNGDARITGILTIGTSTLTLDGSNNQVNVGSATTINTTGFTIGNSFLHSTGLSLGSGNITSHNINSTGIITATQFVTGASGSAIGINTNTISGPATITIDPAAVGDNTGLVVIAGNLQVDGTTTTINSTTMTVDDINITLASGAANAAAADGAGITIDGASATLLYASTGDKWVFNKDVEAGNFNSTSDINLKENIRQVESASELVSKLEGVHFSWKETGKETIGVIAQQIEEHLPQLVQTGDTHKTVNYNGLIGVLIEAVKEQGAQIAALQAEIEELKK